MFTDGVEFDLVRAVSCVNDMKRISDPQIIWFLLERVLTHTTEQSETEIIGIYADF